MTANAITLTIGGSLDLVLRAPPPEIETTITVRCGGFTATAKVNAMAYTLPNDRLVVVQVGYTDAHGNPAQIDGAVGWTTSNPDVVQVTTDAADSTMCTITPVGPAATAQVVATADADLGTGVKSLLTTLDVQVVAGEAVAGTIVVKGDPQPIP